MAVCESSDLSCWSANSAAYVEDFHAAFQADPCCEIMLVSGNGLVEGFVGREAAEVEGLAPSFFVEACC